MELFAKIKNISDEDKSVRKSQSMKEKPVLQYLPTGEFIAEYDSISDASEAVGVSASYIGRCANGRLETAGGYVWKFKTVITVLQYSLAGKFLKEYLSIAQAAAETGVHRAAIERCLAGKKKSGGGYRWKKNTDCPNHEDIEPYKKRCVCGGILQFDKNGSFVKKYPSLKEAAIAVGGKVRYLSDRIRKNINTAYGYIWFEDTGEDIQIVQADLQKKVVNKYPVRKRGKSKAVRQFTIDGVFVNCYASIKDAAMAVGCSASCIWYCVHRKTKTARGYIWLEDNGEDVQNIQVEPFKTRIWRKIVCQFTVDGVLVDRYASVAEAARALGVSSTSILKCVNGNAKTAYGYVWIEDTCNDAQRTIQNRIASGYYEQLSYNRKSKPVYQCTSNGHVINRYSSFSEAAKAVGGSVSGICQCISGKTKTAYGYVWKEATDSDIP